jgi:AcrR family transcriptional regulator
MVDEGKGVSMMEHDALITPGARRPTREQRSVELRKRLFDAAAQVVGEFGYADASISRITERAGIAQGTFYLYFESRQALFDELLPHVGQDMVAYISKAVRNSADIWEVEERGLRAFFAFLRRQPGFFKILNQAETAAPRAHAKHMALLTEHYIASLKRSVAKGEIRDFSDRELEAIAQVFMGARSYLYLRYLKNGKPSARLPDWVIGAYMKLVRSGLR